MSSPAVKALAFTAWAALRPMTELEFEKACRGTEPSKENEFAWGTSQCYPAQLILGRVVSALHDHHTVEKSALEDALAHTALRETQLSDGTLALDANSPLIRAMGRMLGIRMMDEAERRRAQGAQGQQGGVQQRQTGGMGGMGGMVANRPIQGSVNQATMQIPSGQGWRVDLSYSASRQRPPVGSNVQSLDPTIVCEQYRLLNPLSYDACVRQQQTSGSVSNPYESTTRGGTGTHRPFSSAYHMPSSFWYARVRRQSPSTPSRVPLQHDAFVPGCFSFSYQS